MSVINYICPNRDCRYAFHLETTRPAACPSCGKSARLRILDKLSANAKTLIEHTPEHPSLRGMILAQTNLWVPNELKTGPEITAWLREQDGSEPVPPPEPKKILVKGTYTETESGQCNYSCRNIGNFEFSLSETRIAEIAESAHDIPDFEGQLASALDEHAQENKCETGRDNMQTDGFDLSEDGAEDFNPDYNFSEIARAAKALLTPEQLARLSGQEPEPFPGPVAMPRVESLTDIF